MVYTLLANGFEEIEALAVVDILRRAQIPVKTLAISDELTVVGAHDIKVVADMSLQQADMSFDVLFLPGGYPGYVNLENEEKVLEIIKQAYDEKKLIAAICAAPSVLGKMKLLTGKKACCFPSFEDKLIGADVSYDDVCVSDNIITSRGAGTAHKLAFKLVEILKDKQTANELKKAMIYDNE